MEKIVNRFRKNKIEFLFLIAILAIAAFFRFYKIYESFYFIGDAGRDCQATFKILVDHKLTLIGPRASVAGFFLGPFYFYLIAIPLWLFRMDPIGLGFFASFLGVVAVFFIYLLAKELFGHFLGLIVAFLYGVSSLVVSYSRMAWNPSPVPLFTILLLWCLFFFKKTRDIKWFLGSWVIMGLGIQLHYTFIYLLPPLFLCFLLIQKKVKSWLLGSILGLVVVAFFNFSLIIFDLRHHFITSRALTAFLTSEKVGFNLLVFGQDYWQHLKTVIDLTILERLSPNLKAIFLLGLSFVCVLKEKKRENFFLLLLTFFGSVLSLSFFKGTIQLYYYSFLFPFPFLLLGCFFSLLKEKKYLKILISFFTLFFFHYNLTPNMNPPRPSRTLKEIKEVTASIVAKVPPSSRFNIASFFQEPWYSAEEYRCFSYYFGKRAQGAEDYKNIEKLFVISSGPMENPLAIKSQETVDFGARKVEDQWVVGSVRIFELSR